MASEDEEILSTTVVNTGPKQGANKSALSGWTLVYIAGIISFFGGGIAAALIVLLSAESPSHAYAERACATEQPSPLEINACLKTKCTFDVTTCPISCPFGYMLGDDRVCEESCDCASKGRYQADMAFTEQDVLPMAKAYDYSTEEKDFEVFFGSAYKFAEKWEHHRSRGRFTIYYEFNTTIKHYYKPVILENLKVFSDKTCIDFVERKDDKMPYFTFNEGDGCWSVVGYAPELEGQELSLGEGCYTPRVIRHEVIHILGFGHEQSRSDRDAYVIVHDENILKPDGAGQFTKLTRYQTADVYSAYELLSAMHYGPVAFSKDGVSPTVVNRITGKPVELPIDTTEGDFEEVNVLYGCLDHIDGQWTKWSDWSLCDNTCGRGAMARYRRCEDMTERLVEGCKGENMESHWCVGDCDGKPTKPPGEWGLFFSNGTCDKTCGGGIQLKLRLCLPEGSHCEGTDNYLLSCATEECPAKKGIKAIWGEWEPWSDCTYTCGGGVKKRSRHCLGNPTGWLWRAECKLDTGSYSTYEQQNGNCNPDDCKDEPSQGSNDFWGEWTACSMTCDGMRTRRRECSYFILNCDATETQSEECNVGVCKTVVPAFFVEEAENVPKVLCGAYDGSQWYYGDFNGDDRMDVMCVNSVGVYKLGQTNVFGTISSENWKGLMDECEAEHRFTGDFNGDKHDDFICQSKSKRRLTLKFSTLHGAFDSNKLDAGSFCTDEEDILLLADVNGDGKKDLVCHHVDKRVELRLNTL